MGFVRKVGGVIVEKIDFLNISQWMVSVYHLPFTLQVIHGLNCLATERWLKWIVWLLPSGGSTSYSSELSVSDLRKTAA